MNNNDNESLKKSHSVWSNSKLTLLALMATFAVSLLWVSIACLDIERIDNVYCYIALAVSGVLTLLSLVLFSKFKR